MPEIVICTIDDYNKYNDDEYEKLLSKSITGWSQITDDEYKALVDYQQDNYPRRFIIIRKVPIESKSEPTIVDYIKDAIDYNKKREAEKKKYEELKEKTRKANAKKKAEKDLKNLEALKKKVAELEKIKNGN